MLEIDSSNKTARELKKLIDTLASKPNSGVKLIAEQKYKPSFLKKKESEIQKKKGQYTVLDTKDVFISLEL